MAAPRAVLDRTSVTDTSGTALESAQVYVFEDDGTTPFAAPMYSASSGGTLLANPFSSGANGAISCYTQYPKTCVVRVNGVSAPAEFIEDPEYAQSGLGPRVAINVAGFGGSGVDISLGVVSAATALSDALVIAALYKAPVYFPAGIYNFSTAQFSITTANNGLTMILERGAIIKGRDTGTTFAVAANDVTIEGGEWTRIGTSASNWTCTLFGVSGDRFTLKDAYIHDLGGLVVSTSGSYARIQDNWIKATGLNNRSALTDVGAPNTNLHDPVGSAVYCSGTIGAIITGNRFQGCGGPVVNFNLCAQQVVANNHFIGTPRTSSVTITTTQAGGGGNNETQRVSITSSCTNGVFYLGFGVDATPEIPIDYTAAELSAELQLLSTIGVGNVSVTGAFPTWDVTFIGALANTNVAQMTTTSAFLDAQENCIYDTGSVSCVYDGNLFQDFSKEAVRVGGSKSTISNNTFRNTVAKVSGSGEIGISLNATGFWVVTGNVVDGTNIAQAIVTDAGPVTDSLIAGNTFIGSLLQAQSTIDGLVFSDNQCSNGFKFAINSDQIRSNVHINRCTFRGFNTAADIVIQTGEGTVTNCTFTDIVAAGIFGRTATTERNVVVSGCRLTGSNTVPAIIHGTNTSMTTGAGDLWILHDNDFAGLPPSTSTGGSGTVTPLTAVPPFIWDRLDLGRQYDGYASLAPAAVQILMPAIVASSTSDPLSARVEITGTAGGTIEKVVVHFVKVNTTVDRDLTSVSGTAGGIFALADFTDGTSATANTLTPTFTANTIGATGGFRWRVVAETH